MPWNPGGEIQEYGLWTKLNTGNRTDICHPIISPFPLTIWSSKSVHSTVYRTSFELHPHCLCKISCGSCSKSPSFWNNFVSPMIITWYPCHCHLEIMFIPMKLGCSPHYSHNIGIFFWIHHDPSIQTGLGQGHRTAARLASACCSQLTCEVLQFLLTNLAGAIRLILGGGDVRQAMQADAMLLPMACSCIWNATVDGCEILRPSISISHYNSMQFTGTRWRKQGESRHVRKAPCWQERKD